MGRVLVLFPILMAPEDLKFSMILFTSMATGARMM